MTYYQSHNYQEEKLINFKSMHIDGKKCEIN